MAHTPQNIIYIFLSHDLLVVRWLEAEARIWLCGFERNTVWYNAHNCYEIQAQQYVAGIARSV